jgi:hypothetical protein
MRGALLRFSVPCLILVAVGVALLAARSGGSAASPAIGKFLAWPPVAAKPRSDGTVRPGRGIGPVGLGETQRSIERQLGKGRAASDGISLEFVTPHGPIDVEFDSAEDRSNRRATAIQTQSTHFSLAGITLADGYERIAQRLRSWKAAGCDKVKYVIRDESPTGPATAWGFDELLGPRIVIQRKAWGNPCAYLRGQNEE